jgi:hypothetical protein
VRPSGQRDGGCGENRSNRSFSFARLPNAIGIKVGIVLTRISRGGATGLNEMPVPATSWQHGSRISIETSA